MPGAIVVERTVSHSSTDTSLVRDVSTDMLDLEPDQSPLLVLTARNNRKEPTDTPKFEWFEKAEVPVWDTVASATDYSTTTTTVLVTDITLYCNGDILLFPQATSSAAMEELALVTAVGTNAVTITRGLGGTTAAAIGSTQSIRILGGGLVEGGSLPAIRSAIPVAKASYAAIFRTPVDISRTMAATKAYTSPKGKRTEMQVEALRRHKEEIEAAGLWSAGSQSLSASGSTWTTQGWKPTVSTNITNATTTFTLTKFNDFCETAFRYGAPEKLLMSGPHGISALSFFSQSKLLTSVGDTKFGVKLTRWLANGFGEFMMANNFRMGDGVAGKDNFNDEMYSIDLPSVSFRYLNGNGESQDTKLFEDVVKDGKAAWKDEYYTQAGWQVRHEKKHARIYGIVAYQ